MFCGIIHLMNPFRKLHLLKILESRSNLPLDVQLSNYFRAHKACGSKDRKWISDTIYNMVRWQGLLDALITKPPTWEKRLDAYQNFNPLDCQSREDLPAHVRVSFPKFLYQMLLKSYGTEKTHQICLALNEQAPTTVRVNLLKISRADLMKKLSDFSVFPTEHSPTGITFSKKINFLAMPEFKTGLFEVQDEGSQLLAALVRAKPGDHVLDFCAGSGGKSLAIAPSLEETGQLYLHDIRKNALLEARKRLKRAGVQNAQIVFPEKINNLRGKMDWILVDAPCSGTGSLRRNPSMKWKLTPNVIENLMQTQREIFKRALQFLKPGGHIIYATCSILACENEEQIAHFIRDHTLNAKEKFQSLPESGKMDGFFAQTLVF